MSPLPVACSWILAVVACSASVAQAARPTDKMFPATTKAYVSIPNVKQLTDQFNRSPWGRLLQDPIMQPFREDLNRQMQERGAELKDAIGVAVRDFDGLTTGEVGVGIIKNAQGKSTIGALLDVSGNLPGAQKLLDQVDKHLVNVRRAKRTEQNFQGVPLRVYDVPGSDPAKGGTQGVYFFIEGHLGISNDLGTAQQIVLSATGQSKESLATLPAYTECLNRANAAINVPPHLSYWLDPVGSAETARATNPKPSKQGASTLKIVKAEGFDAVQGIGGHVNFAINNCGVMYRSAIYAPGPYKRAMQMLSLLNGGDYTPQPWVPRNIAGYSSLRLDALNAFDNFGSLFDSIFGEGSEESVWPDVLDSLKNDPNGPRVDLRNDVIAHLTNRATMISDNTKPIGPYSQRRLFAAETKNPQALAAAIDRLMGNDKSVKVHEVNGVKIYEIIPEAPDELPEIELNNVKAIKKKDVNAPHSGVAVAHGQLFIASHFLFIQEIIEKPTAAEPLAAHRDYAQTQIALKQFLPNVIPAVQGFSDDNEVYITMYEMFRMGRLAESNVPIAKALNSILNDPAEGKKWKQLDGTKLPEFNLIKQYGSVGGGTATSEPNGWFHFGFTLDPRAGQAEAARREVR